MIKVFVMQTCPDCIEVKEKVQDNPRFLLIDIGEHVRNLKQFLRLRDNNPAFDAIKQQGSVGIPCFVLEDGRVTFDSADVELDKFETGSSCSIDGKGC